MAKLTLPIKTSDTPPPIAAPVTSPSDDQKAEARKAEDQRLQEQDDTWGGW